MAKDATLNVRMDAEVKAKVEKLYRDMGTSFAEAVRMFAVQSLKENGMPMIVAADRTNTYDRFARYTQKVLELEVANGKTMPGTVDDGTGKENRKEA